MDILINKAIADIRKYGEKFDNVFVNYSGGRYSTVLLHLALKSLNNIKVLYVDTTISLPDCEEYVNDLQKLWNFELIKLKREDTDFWKIVNRRGFPHNRFRWCLKEIKSVPLKAYNKSINGNNLHLTGTSKKESSMRQKIYSIRGKLHFNPSICSYVLHPLLEWNDKQIGDYLMINKIPINPSYKRFGHGGNCYYCPYQKKKKYYLKLYKEYPDLYQNIIDAENSMINKGAAIYLGKGKKMYLSKIIEEI